MNIESVAEWMWDTLANIAYASWVNEWCDEADVVAIARRIGRLVDAVDNEFYKKIYETMTLTCE